MLSRLKQYLFIAILAAAGYFLLSNHIVFHGKKPYFLKKASYNLNYTFYSISEKKPETILEVDILRDAGIGDLLVEAGRITDEEKMKIESKYN